MELFCYIFPDLAQSRGVVYMYIKTKQHKVLASSSGLYVLSSKNYEYSLHRVIMSLFTYAIEVWAYAYDRKYLAQTDKFCKRAEKYGYTNKHYNYQ